VQILLKKRQLFVLKALSNIKIHKFLSSRGYCNPKIPEVFEVVEKNGKTYSKLYFRTWYLQSFKELHELFYRPATENDRQLGRGNERYIKRVPTNISDFINPMALAFWIMDDGSYVKDRVSTDGFTFEEATLLQQALLQKLELKCNLQTIKTKSGKKQPRLYFPKNQMPALITKVKPFIIPSMYYKLGPFLD
jgi:hypothetical protein